MAESSFNISAFANRLGLKNVRELPLIERVQPVVSIGEFAPLTPALVPPAFLAGGFFGAIAGEVGSFAVHCLGPGGAFVTVLSCSLTFRVGINAAPPVGLGSVAIRSAASNAGPGACVATFGTQPAQLSVFNATFLLGQVVPPMYVPRGQHLLIEAAAAATAVSFAVFVSDVPATEGAFEETA